MMFHAYTVSSFKQGCNCQSELYRVGVINSNRINVDVLKCREDVGTDRSCKRSIIIAQLTVMNIRDVAITEAPVTGVRSLLRVRQWSSRCCWLNSTTAKKKIVLITRFNYVEPMYTFELPWLMKLFPPSVLTLAKSRVFNGARIRATPQNTKTIQIF